MDIFVFPSRVEGLGMAAVEAQFCGVRTVVSDRVQDDAKVSDGTISLSLMCSAKVWADSILKQGKSGKIYKDKYDEYDISKKSIILTDYYREVVYGKDGTDNTSQYFAHGKQG